MNANQEQAGFSLILGGARSGKSALAEKLAQTRGGEGSEVLYVATLLPADPEMQERVAAHRAARPAAWRTLEAPYKLSEAVLAEAAGARLVLLDCLTVWAGNLVVREEKPGDTSSQVEPGGLYDSAPANAPGRRSALEPDRELVVTSELQEEMEAAGRLARSRPQPPPDYRRLENEMLADLEQLVNGLRERGIGLVMVSNEVGMGLVPPYPLGRVYRDLLGRLNQRMAALADEVLLVVAGLPLDLKRFQGTF